MVFSYNYNGTIYKCKNILVCVRKAAAGDCRMFIRVGGGHFRLRMSKKYSSRIEFLINNAFV